MAKYNLILLAFLGLFWVSPGQAQSWRALYDSSDVYWERSEYAKAVKVLEKALPLAKTNYEADEKDTTYALTLNDLGICYTLAGDFQKAEKIYQDALVINKKVLGENHIDFAILLNNIGRFYDEIGKFTQADSLYKQSIQTYQKIAEDKSFDFTMSLNNLALLYLKTGRYQESEQLHKQLVSLRKDIVGENHAAYAAAVNNLAGLYTEMGVYSQAIMLFKKALQIRKETLGEHHPDYANSLYNLATLYADDSLKHLEAEEMFKQAIEIRKAALGVQHPDYAMSLNGLANLYGEMRRYAEAETLHQQAADLRQNIFGTRHHDYASSLNNLAALYYKTGEFPKAEALFTEALDIYQEVFGPYHPNQSTFFSNLGFTYVRMHKNDQAESFLKLAANNYLHQNHYYLPFLSEKEKEEFLQSASKNFEAFNSFVLLRQATHPAITGDMYNHQLAMKGLLLYTTRKVRESILESGERDLIQQFEQWQSLRESLARYYQFSSQALSAQHINLDSLEAVADGLEKELSVRSETFSQTYQQPHSWQDVQQELGVDEAALEMIRFRKYNFATKAFTDTIHYAALIVTPTSAYPKLVTLEQGHLMENRLLNAYREDIRQGRQESNAYQYYWQPISEALQGVSTLYFSPDGAYHQINPATLYNPASGTYLLDELQIVHLTSTRDLLTKKTRHDVLVHNEALLLGDPNYDLSEEKYMQQLVTVSLTPSPSEGAPLRLERGFDPVPLPGTRQELEQVASLLEKHQVASQLYLQEDALEEVVKQVDNPGILHMATHGFFEPDPDPEKPVQNPLLRSGLLLTGAARTLQDTATYDPLSSQNASEDGILTAYEAMNLNLEKTELVVLSACETGLGEIRNGEGVYGLQRAFTIAGAKAILMSLWKVDDQATQQLITTFYQHWLKTKHKTQAFREAQQQLRRQYPDPYYWGAFVMIGQ